MLNIYHAPHTRSFRIIWLCEELLLPYQVTAVDFSKTYRARPEWRKLSPLGKVPVMTDGDLLMFESGAMVQYVLDRYGQSRLQPESGTPEHAHFLQWCWFAEATFARPVGEIFNHMREFPGDKAVPAVLEEMQNRSRDCLGLLDAHTSANEYVLGEQFSAADIMIGYSIQIAEFARLLTGPTDLNYPNLAKYWQRLGQREAYLRALPYNEGELSNH